MCNLCGTRVAIHVNGKFTLNIYLLDSDRYRTAKGARSLSTMCLAI